MVQGVGAITVAPNAGHVSGDYELLLIDTDNGTTVSLSTAAGFTAVPSGQAVVGTGPSTSSATCTLYERIWNGTDGSPTIADSGNHQSGFIVSFSGTAGGSLAACREAVTTSTQAATTSGSASGGTTGGADRLVCVFVVQAGPDVDADPSTEFSAWANGALTSITEQKEYSQASGNGATVGFTTGVKATSGAIGSTTFTCVTSSAKAMVTLALIPAASGESHSGTLVVTGGGVITAALTTNRNRSGSLTGGGVLGWAKSTARNLAQLLTGGGVLTPARTSNRNLAQLLTGGGVLTSVRQKGGQVAFTRTGGGVIVLAAAGGRQSSDPLTGGGVIHWLELTSRLATFHLTGSGQLLIAGEGGDELALTDLGVVMCAIGDALKDANVANGRVFCYPPDSIAAPATVVGYPNTIDFDSTMMRGADRLEIPVYFLTGKTSEPAAQAAIAAVITGATGVKDVLDGNLGGVVQTLRVQQMRVINVELAGVSYLSAVFTVEAFV